MQNGCFDFELLLAVIAAAAAIIGIFQTKKQIELSNKHLLFDRRLNMYHKFKELTLYYKENRECICDIPSSYKSMAFKFNKIKDTTRLLPFELAMEYPRSNDKEEKLFALCQDIKKDAEDLSVMWNKKDTALAGRCIELFSALLLAIYQQHIYMVNIHSQSENMKTVGQNGDSDEELYRKAKAMAEQLGLFETVRAIDDIYTQIEASNIEKKLLDGLRL